MDEKQRKIEVGKKKIEELYGKQKNWPPDDELLEIIRFNKWHLFNKHENDRRNNTPL